MSKLIFEVYEDTVIYAEQRDEPRGAILETDTGEWMPMQMLDSGRIDIIDEDKFDTPSEAYRAAVKIFT